MKMKKLSLNQSRHKAMLFGTTVLAVILAAASVASACTSFRGRMIVTGDSSSFSQVIGDNTFNMTHCYFDPGAQTNNSGGSFTVEIRTWSGGSGCNATTLPDATYDVNVANDIYSYPGYSRIGDCMNRSGAPLSGSEAGKITVSSGAAAKKAFPVPAGLAADGPSDESAVCVSDYNGNYGNFAPIHLF
jgi:hypothetical protein